MTYLPFSVFSFQFFENSFSQDSLPPPIPSPQWEGCHSSLQSDSLKNQQFSLKVFSVLKPLPWSLYCASLQFIEIEFLEFFFFFFFNNVSVIPSCNC